jgi:transcriptional regulator with XRE-family HTH domain
MARARITQRVMAEKLNCQEGTVSKLLNGKMEMTNTWLMAFSMVLGLQVPDLYRDPNDDDPAALFSDLSVDQRREAERFIRYLKSQN